MNPIHSKRNLALIVLLARGCGEKPFDRRAGGPESAESTLQPGYLPQDISRFLAIADLEKPSFHRPRRGRLLTPRGFLLAFWAFETDFGQTQGDFKTRNALPTLAQDCRWSGVLRPQIFTSIALQAAVELPLDTTVVWASEIGMV
ncbi:lytic murein transglycosylase [Rhodobacteraceae bacterium HSP-20]|uniref:Lytic murein transglycosylase n=1 Tax=Paragemmobacter amnigenus TaxID=2852097 RepID=A0ABS6J6T5_9RHOB|nr:lytic murein transglycosylase [Rhodobacter amnigenus]MBU9698941.1 lytic murein transglycosylase [Rhodobacter amnigenus]MBV4390168.1 lytic murein transglycosylase [Rhodobacter amnigenus]